MPLSIEQFDKLATKDDLKELKQEMATKEELRAAKDEILGAVDKITKEYKNHKIEHVSNIAAHDRFEKRITRVEKKVDVTA